MSDESDPKNTEKKTTLLYPYAIGLVFECIVLLGLVTALVYYYNLDHSCEYKPEVWCYDDWYCNYKCTGCSQNNINECYCDSGNQGLMSCLVGPTSKLATNCQVSESSQPCTNSTPGSQNYCACNCNVKSSNCLNQCPTNTKTYNKLNRASQNCCTKNNSLCKNPSSQSG